MHPRVARLVVQLLVFSAVGGLLYLIGDVLDLQSLFDPDALQAKRELVGPRMVGLYLMLWLAMFGSTGMPTLVGAVLFGWKGGAVMAVIGATMSGTVFYWLSRTLLADVVDAWMGDRTRMLAELLRRRGLALMVVWRMVMGPIMPLNLAAGSTRIPFPVFLLSILAMVPGTLTYTLLVDSLFIYGLRDIPPVRWAAIVSLAGGGLTTWLLAVRRWPELRLRYRNKQAR